MSFGLGFRTTATFITLSAATHYFPEVPRCGEWTTIDVISEKLEPGKFPGSSGKYALTVLFGGRQVYKNENIKTCDLEYTTVLYGSQPGYVRNLRIMTK